MGGQPDSASVSKLNGYAVMGGQPNGASVSKLTGYAVVNDASFLRSSQVVAEVLTLTPAFATARSSQVVAEVLTYTPVTSARSSQVVAEVLTVGTSARASQTVAEVLSINPPGLTGIINDRDKLLQATVPRYTSITTATLLLTGSTQTIANGVPSTVVFVATRLGIGSGAMLFTTANGSPLTISGDTATMVSANMVGNTEVVTASVISGGTTYTAVATVSKVANGSNGSNGTNGNSARVGYSVTALGTLASTPATITTAGNSSFPPDTSWGSDTHWTGSPTTTLTAGQSMYRIDGTYDAVLDQTVWNKPYLANLKVGQLSALAVDAGYITAGDFYGTTMHGGPGYPTNAYAWPATALSGGGFHLSASGLLLGNYLAGTYASLKANGDIDTPQFKVTSGVATFGGDLQAARMSVGGGTSMLFYDPASPSISLHSTADGSFSYTGTVGAAVVTATSAKFKNNDGSWAIERRIRTGTVYFYALATSVVDDQLSIWYRVNGGTWTWLAGQAEPQANDGSVAAGSGLTLSIGLNDYVEFGLSPTDSSYSAYDMGKLYLKGAQMTINARNF
jgi:hypothetical protein